MVVRWWFQVSQLAVVTILDSDIVDEGVYLGLISDPINSYRILGSGIHYIFNMPLATVSLYTV